jgi:hypothetical protein
MTLTGRREVTVQRLLDNRTDPGNLNSPSQVTSQPGRKFQVRRNLSHRCRPGPGRAGPTARCNLRHAVTAYSESVLIIRRGGLGHRDQADRDCRRTGGTVTGMLNLRLRSEPGPGPSASPAGTPGPGPLSHHHESLACHGLG